MANKTSVQLYYDYREQFELLSDSQMRKVVYAMIEYDECEKLPKLDKVSAMAFSFIKKRIDYDKNKYNDKCFKNKANIEKYWKNKNIRTNTNVYEPIRSDTNYTDIELELDIDIELDKELDIDTNNINNNIIKEKKNNKSEREKENKKIEDLKGEENVIPAGAPTPTLPLIVAYGKELGMTKEYCEKFFNYYESIGWLNGNGLEIKNWKMVFNNWVSKDKKNMSKEIKKEKRVL